MSRTGVKSVLYDGDSCLGEVEVFPAASSANAKFQFPNNEIHIHRFTPPSDRCPPLAVIHAISPFSIKCKLQATSAVDDHHSPLTHLYLSCFQELKTAIVVVGNEELHLIAMPSKVEKVPSFWCCSVQPGLYAPCMAMLNLRCLSIVFDLDETLIVANTMKSFEDKIEALSRRIDEENEPVRVSGMSAELKRLLEDKTLLKQYIESDTVVENGVSIGVQNEEVPPLPGFQERIVRPIVRLQERGVVLTRINPEIRDTSVLVRLRPAWDDLKSYLTAKGRKRFEVYVCTMAEREYALEIWRLLDPETHLISSKQLLDRIVCVKSGYRKSLLQVFQDGICHPKMAMVIDDRMKVWDDRDQPRVHIVPPFTPYYAPQAEMANAVPVLCVARNVACNVRGGFFKDFDENLLQRVFELRYENEMTDLPHAPDASYYLMTEDTGAGLSNNRDIPISEGINCTEVEANLNRTASFGANQQPVESQALSVISSHSGPELPTNRTPANNRDLHIEAGSYITALQEIARICALKIEFRSVVSSSRDLQFAVEVFISSDKIGVGLGRTKNEAQMQAAENSLIHLANNFAAFVTFEKQVVAGGLDKVSSENGNGYLEADVISANGSCEKVNQHYTSTADHIGLVDTPKKLAAVLSSIEELCTEGQSLVFQDLTLGTITTGQCYVQAEVAGKKLGKGVASSAEEAKLKAAEETLKILKASGDLPPQKHQKLSR